MFHTIRPSIMERMHYLEQRDAQEREEGVPRSHRLRQISPEVGRFLALLAACSPEGACIEIGTSAGYSTLWIVLAMELLGRTITTFEISLDKAQLARETFHKAQVEGVVNLVVGDARSYLLRCHHVSFCFLDAEKEIYSECYEKVVPNLVKGGLLVADNSISHQETLKPMLDRALTDERVDAMIVPIGKGVLVCRKI